MQRLTRHGWNITSYKLIGTKGEPELSDMTSTFYTNGCCEGGSVAVVLPGQVSVYVSLNYDFSGNWELIENDDKLKIQHKFNGSYTVWFIEELDSKKFKIINDSVELYMTAPQ